MSFILDFFFLTSEHWNMCYIELAVTIINIIIIVTSCHY